MRPGSRSEKSLQFSAIGSIKLHEARIVLAGVPGVEHYFVVVLWQSLAVCPYVSSASFTERRRKDLRHQNLLPAEREA